MAPLQRLWAAACCFPDLQQPRESVDVSLSHTDTLVEGDLTSTTNFQRDQGWDARVLDMVLIMEGLEIGERETAETNF